MCGLTGFLFSPGALEVTTAKAQVHMMADAIQHRGPDSNGLWVDTEAGVALGHLRLAIVDLSSAGHQPMKSQSDRYMLSFNGEIYNYQALRAELEQAGYAPAWRGHSDTEVLLAGFDIWGIEATISRAVGMFAMAIWDAERRQLTLVRDRHGEKPLYYGWQQSTSGPVFLFGSELPAVRSHPAFAADIDRTQLCDYLRYSYVGGAHSIHEGIHKLRPGEMAVIEHGSPGKKTAQIARHIYWSGGEVAASRGGAAAQHFTSDAHAIEALESLMIDATQQQMMADVPLGAFLSGGIDSATVVALMQHISANPVHTFSIGFHEKRYNEAGFAADIAAHLGTKHTELYVGEQELRDVIPRLACMYDEPFADSSQIPTFLVSQMARNHVTVALTGDGGDELFCGYDRYQQGAAFMQRLRGLPSPLRRSVAGAMRCIPATTWNRVLEPVRPTPQGKEPNGQRLHRLADYLRSGSIEDLHRKLVSRWRMPEDAVLGANIGDGQPNMLDGAPPPAGDLGDTERMMQLDMLTYMPDDILTKVDRASMAVALECRAPMLDHRVAEFAWSLPLDMKLRDGVSKWILRQVLYRHVPQTLMERPKMGFEVPIGLWLRDALRDWADALLDPTRLAREGYFEPAIITKIWQQHLTGSHNWGPQLWNVLMFQAWLEAQNNA